MKAALAAFSNLPLEEKKYSMAKNDLQGYGEAYVVSEEQKLDWGDSITLMTCPLEARNMKYRPNTLPGFKPDLVLGVIPHSDGRSITVLLQESNVSGLQVKYTEGWLPVKPIPNALVVNVGDVLGAMGCTKALSTEPRRMRTEQESHIQMKELRFVRWNH
ncbi:Isopenicillin N synthase-like [Parasponia andersonii]|uniref:Isopenicillin N synthase-like n=1 Tax=Parasponia andersonii TaxID=3476 RepID=A0A2P5BAK2_PARAD|nr:Isopenicillin N synthase-like [Parasponia andersonii]